MSLVCTLLQSQLFESDTTFSLIIISTVFLLLILFVKHPLFSKQENSNSSDIILDDLEGDNKSQEKTNTYFLRIHRVFSFAFIIIGIGYLFLSTETSGHNLFDKRIKFVEFIVLGLVMFLIALTLWKFPKIISWIVALLFVGMFLFMLIRFYELFVIIITSIHNADLTSRESWVRIVSLLFFAFSFLFLALIILSKTAREEWKMK
ncbi:hypothetical protein WAF17_07280 [Bernardetia sp. ABR2-2B]|uniref:hypothetical protein n=1 Tax=Bernardetia sp. ABR2-2B TaxID=3127472 RepID=UPI0030D49B2F